MSWLRITTRRMSHLAAKFTGKGDVHVVDPLVDLRYLWEDADLLKRSLEERRSKVDLADVKNKYDQWWSKYEEFLSLPKESAGAAKKELRAAQEGLLLALALPNRVYQVGTQEKQMLKQSKHTDYLCKRGLMRLDKTNELVHLVGYPVLIQNNLRNQLLDMFVDASLVSPSCFARAAVLEGVNVNLNDYLAFTDQSQSFPLTYLVGHSLPALLSSFIRTQFSDKNEWPITVQATGTAYHAKRNTVDLAYGRQRMKHCALSMGTNDDHLEQFITTAASNIGALLEEGLLLDVKARVVRGKELRNYESQAIVFEDKGLELARISRIGDYISRRLNISSESGGFLQMAYAETDIDRVLARIIDGLIDGADIPKTLRDIVKI